MPANLVVVGLAAIALTAHVSAPARLHTRIAGWTLEVRQDRFTSRQVCSLRRGEVHYERGALVFQLPRHVDTSDAAYRIDGGAALWTRADQAELASLGFALHDDDLANPSGGVVRIVLGLLPDAHTVSIEPHAFGKAWRFNVTGFGQARDAAFTRCTQADFDRAWDFRQR